jgi:hypothetical protein
MHTEGRIGAAAARTVADGGEEGEDGEAGGVRGGAGHGHGNDEDSTPEAEGHADDDEPTVHTMRSIEQNKTSN